MLRPYVTASAALGSGPTLFLLVSSVRWFKEGSWWLVAQGGSKDKSPRLLSLILLEMLEMVGLLVVNENRFLPSRKLRQTMTIPSGFFDGKGLGEAEESKHTG